ncbi:hypothetical protein RJ640_008337 [Escallonia rubra]|uniref:Pumilio homolog 23 n=1 Tax=Escallonia rubra TaxID=112253 RepID=A0AA88QIF1_9ASTE|nr:hypothetical protein RJ640_008337 [Escallonia rubra]
MVSVGSKALPLRKAKARNLTEDCVMAGEDHLYNQGGRKRSMSRKATKKHGGFDGDNSTGNFSGGGHDKTVRSQKFSKHQEASVPQTSFVRTQADPETTKYFSEIANVIESTEIELEERMAICGNALEEARGKEVELANDYIISHTLQILLEGCDVDHLCGFLQSCSKGFCSIAMDRSGSHVAETALKSLAMHLQDDENHMLVEETLTTICKAIVANPVEVMHNCHGSHVLRSLLCLCKGVPLDSSEFHATKSSTVLAARLNIKPPRHDRNDSQHCQQGFEDLLKFLVTEMLKAAKQDIASLQVDQYSSLTALKFLVGHEQELSHAISILLGCSSKNAVDGSFTDTKGARNLLSLMKQTAFSRLMEVILGVAPENLYNELLTKVFRDSLFEMSSDNCGNFVVQALISHARSEGHMELLWKELGTKFKDLFVMGRSGVVASLIAASQRLHSNEQKCCQALAAAVCLANESPGCIIPRLLFLDHYFWCEDKSNWNWPDGVKMHIMGSLILQLVFKLPSEYIQTYIASITSLEVDHLREVSKDSGGARVIEAFLTSDASTKQKRKLVAKLRGHFAELSVHQSGSFTVEKCFNVGNVSLREAIVSELLDVQTELSKTKQGPHLLRKLDVDGYAKRPDQWKSRQVSKESTYKEFYTAFGQKETRTCNNDPFLADTHGITQPEKLKQMKKEIDTRLASSIALPLGSQFLSQEGLTAKSRMSGSKRRPGRVERSSEKLAMDDDVSERKNKKHKKKKGNDSGGTVNAVESKTTGFPHHEKPSKSVREEKKRRKEDDLSKSLRKKNKV